MAFVFPLSYQTDKQQRGVFMAERCNPRPRTLLSPISPTAQSPESAGCQYSSMAQNGASVGIVALSWAIKRE